MPAALDALPSTISVELTALGDFEGSAITSKIAPGDARGLGLPFPATTRAVNALGQSGSEEFLGVGSASTNGNIDVLLWRATGTTPLWPTGGANFPTDAEGAAVGLDPQARTLLVAGALVSSADASRAFRVGLADGSAEEVVDGMLPARAFASVTAFGTDFMLLAGGVDPTLAGGDLASSPPLASASEYRVSTARFDRTKLIPLAQPRARHAAVVLTNGETLLVGGQGPGAVALSSLEAISPKDRAARIAGLATLSRPRIGPQAIRLTDGRVLVAGGTKDGAPVGVLEWLTPDAHALTLLLENLVLASSHSFVAMPGGGVLGVGVCLPKGVQACLGDVPKSSVTWFRSDGTPDALPKLAFSPSKVSLIRANDGEPWLYATTTGGQVWKRFDPWTASFDEPVRRPSSGPDAALPGPLAVDSGAFVWLEKGATVRLSGFRHDVRGPYARDVAPLLLTGREHMVPNRFPSNLSSAGIEFGSTGLGLSGTEALVSVADTDYAGVELAITLSSGPPPVVVLGDTRLGGSECEWPSSEPAEPGELLTLLRHTSQVVLSRNGKSRTCPSPKGRLGVALSASGSTPSFVRAIEIRRR